MGEEVAGVAGGHRLHLVVGALESALGDVALRLVLLQLALFAIICLLHRASSETLDILLASFIAVTAAAALVVLADSLGCPCELGLAVLRALLLVRLGTVVVVVPHGGRVSVASRSLSK